MISELEYTRIEETEIPLVIVATDLRSGDEILFRDGSVMSALLASTAMPGILPPQEVDRRQRTLAELACPPDGVAIDHLPLLCDRPLRLDDLSHCDESIALGHDLATTALARSSGAALRGS